MEKLIFRKFCFESFCKKFILFLKPFADFKNL